MKPGLMYITQIHIMVHNYASPLSYKIFLKSVSCMRFLLNAANYVLYVNILTLLRNMDKLCVHINLHTLDGWS